MDDVISEYQKWKQQGNTLRARAKEAMETRFRDLLTEALQVAQEYQRDFGGTLKPPAPVTAFRFRAGAKGAKKAAVKAVKKAAPTSQPDAKSGALLKQLESTRKKIEDLKAAGKPTRNLEDKVYEMEDALRLSGHL